MPVIWKSANFSRVSSKNFHNFLQTLYNHILRVMRPHFKFSYFRKLPTTHLISLFTKKIHFQLFSLYAPNCV